MANVSCNLKNLGIASRKSRFDGIDLAVMDLYMSSYKPVNAWQALQDAIYAAFRSDP